MALPGFIGKTWGRLFSGVAGFAIGSAASDAMRPAFKDLEAASWARFPNVRLSAEALAQTVVAGIRTFDEGAAEARETGFDGKRFAQLVALAGQPAQLGQLVELLQRDVIGEEGFRKGLAQAHVKEEWREPLLALARQLLSPGQLAPLVARGLMPEGEAVALARMSGLSPADFKSMVEAASSPPGPQQLLDLLNRGDLSEGQVRTALRDSGLRAEYVEPIMELRNQLPSPSDVIRFALREVFSPEAVREFGLDQEFPAAAVSYARRIGLDQDTLEKYWAAHWDLPSPEQGFRMFHRDLIDRPRLERLLKALDFVPAWRDEIIQLAYNVPGRIDLRRMYQHGVIDKKRVIRGYLDLGYSPENAALLADFATREKMAPERELTKAEVIALYESRTISREDATEFLGQLGYDPDELAMVLTLADVRHDRAYRTAAISAVRSRFLDREIDTTQATARLDALKVPQDEREQLLDLWLFSRDENPARLTEAQMRGMVKVGLLTADQYEERLRGIGHTAENANLLRRLNFDAKPPA